VGISRRIRFSAPQLWPSVGTVGAVILLAGGDAEDAAAAAVAAAARNFRYGHTMPLDTPPAQARLRGCEPRRQGQQFDQLAASRKTSDSSTATPVEAAAVKTPRLFCVRSLAPKAPLGFQGSPRVAGAWAHEPPV
jgi:hypothetical protein